jgi:hypothetical protein
MYLTRTTNMTARPLVFRTPPPKLQSLDAEADFDDDPTFAPRRFGGKVREARIESNNPSIKRLRFNDTDSPSFAAKREKVDDTTWVKSEGDSVRDRLRLYVVKLTGDDLLAYLLKQAKCDTLEQAREAMNREKLA